MAGLPRAACELGNQTFASVRHSQLYDGVDLILHGNGGHLEYDLEIQPGANLSNLRFELRGDPPSLDAAGRISIGDIVQWRPVAYQTVDGARRPVDCAVRRLSGRVFSFALTGPYRPDLPVVIDPVIESAQVVAGIDSAEDRVLGQAAGYVFGVSKRVDSDNWDVFVSSNGVTTYWGGDGDEQVLGFDVDSNNSRLTLVGATASKNAYTFGTPGNGTTFRGGASDGFLLELSAGRLLAAALVGGPGADRLNDVRRTSGPYLFAGETDDPNWPGFTTAGRPAGGTDAVVGSFGTANDSMWIAGGSGADSAKSIRALPGNPGAWIVAGETESTDFAGKSAPGRDAWVARFSAAPLRLDSIRSWGGSGDDRLTGLAIVPGHGVMLAGSTTSIDLPGAAGSQFNGGNSDGFVAWLDPVDFSPIHSRYLGGPGADEILSLAAWSNDLFLAGFTDSPSLSIPGLLPGSEPSGQQDGLFIHTDTLLNPMVAYRAGGSGNDRFTSAEPLAWGRVNLAGWSESRPWLASLDPFGPPGDNVAAFSMALRYAVVSVTELYNSVRPPVLTIGRDLATYLSVAAYNEPATDGILIVRSTDPAKLRVNGEESALLARTDDPRSPPGVSLEALAGEGEVDIVIAGRTPNPGPVRYPERRVRVRLSPSLAFIQPQPGGVLDTVLGSEADVLVVLAPLLANGEPGAGQDARLGLDAVPALASSDPEVALPAADWFRVGPGVYRFRVKGMRAGTAALTLQSTAIPAAQGQQLPVRVNASLPTQSGLPWTRPLAVLLDHTLPLDFSIAPADRLQFTSEDPTAVAFGNNPGALGGSLLYLGGGGTIRLWVSALRVGGATGIRVEGVLQGKPVNERIEILPVPYTLSLSGSDSQVLLPGATGIFAIDALLKGTLPLGVTLSYQIIRPDSPLARIAARFSDPSVAEIDSRTIDGSRLNLRFKALQLGRTTVELDLNGVPTRLTVDVRQPSLSFGSELRVPALAKVGLNIVSGLLSPASIKAVRLRVSDPKNFGLEWFGQKGPEITFDLTQFYAAILDVKAPAGATGSLFVSALGLPEVEVPIRVMERILLPLANAPRFRFAPGEAALRGSLSYSFAAYEPAAPATSGVGILNYRTVSAEPSKLRVTADPPGICEFPAEVDSGQFALSLPFVCREEGRVKVDLQGPDVSAEQVRFSVWLTAVRTPRPPFFESSKVSVAAGTQAALYLIPNGRRFSGTLVSGDPDRVKLASSPERSGGALLVATSLDAVYVQAFASEGVVWIEAQHDDGSREQIPVFLYPATMAVRTTDTIPTAQLRVAADQPRISAVVLPAPFEPGSGLVIDSSSALALPAGQDPFFLKTASSDTAVAEPLLPNPLFSETDRQRPVNFKINGTGRAVLTAEQPPGFYAARNAGLTLDVVERELKFVVGAAAPGLQTLAYLSATAIPGTLGNSAFDSTVPVTLTSLDPAKLLLSNSQSVPGVPVLTLSNGARSGISVQVLNTALPGDRLRVRVTAQGFTETTTEILVSPAELQWYSDTPRALTISPGNPSSVAVRLGPVDPFNANQLNRAWSGGLLPGATVRLKLQTADPSILGLARTEVDLDANALAYLPLQGLRPGQTDLLITAPEGIVNRVERSPVRVSLWEFTSYSASPGARGLWAPFTISNPRSEPTTVTVRGNGGAPIGLAAAVTSLPSTAPLTLTIPPRGQGTFFWTALAPNNSASILMSAPDFANRDASASYSEPEVAFQAASPLQLSVSNRTATLSLQLQRYTPLPLAAASVAVEVRSSDPRVLRVVSSPVQFKTGQSTATFNVEMLSAGTAILTAVLPPDFAAPGLSVPAILTVVTR